MFRKASTILVAALFTLLLWVAVYFIFPTHPLGGPETAVVFLVCLALVTSIRWVVSVLRSRKEEQDVES